MKRKLRGALLCAAVFAFADVHAEVTARNYIQDGLVVHLDAIENAGYGLHVDTTNVWTDLKGRCDLTVIDANSSWTADSFVPPQSGSYSTAAKDNGSKAKIAYADYDSIDVCVTRRDPSDKSARTILGQSYRTINWQKNGFACRYTTMSCHATLVEDTPYTIYANYVHNDYAVNTNYLDGVPVAEVADNCQVLFVYDRFQIGRDLNTYFSSRAPVHSVRLYNRALEPWEVLFNANIDQMRYRGSDGETLTWPDGIRYANDSIQYRTRATAVTFMPGAGVDNRIRVNDGESAAQVDGWKPDDGTCTLTPVPDANHWFALWVGDTDGLSIAADGTVTLDDRVRFLTCYFVPKTSSGRIWTGAAGDGDWSTAGNWFPSGVPAENDGVLVPAGYTATLKTGTDTPNFTSVECLGTIVISNWTTRLKARDVTVASGGNITCGAAVTNMEAMSRVWVSCSNLTVDAGGKIDVTRKGFYGHVKVTKRGYGPGAANGHMMPGVDGGVAAPSHGGYGGRYLTTEYCYMNILPYDDPAAPSLPGSSGAANEQSYGGDGGGVVRIEATGTVTVNGSILANGRNTSSYGVATDSSSHGQPGSGGSIWITCGNIVGSGVIRAAGGGGDNAPYFTSGVVPGAAAGGGMIAIDYDPARQTSADVEGMTISAAAGLYKTKNFETTCVNADTNHWGADIGTLHFTDSKIVDALLGKSLTGQIRGLGQYTWPGDLDFMNGHVRFADIGVAVSVGGNLTLSGDGVARLEVGGCIATNRYTYADLALYAGTNPCSLTVGGNLTLGGRSRLDIRAAATNDVDAFGALVSVGGAMTIGSNCVVTATSDIINLGAPKFEVGSLYVATGGVFTADERGGRGGFARYVPGLSEPLRVAYGSGPGSHKSSTAPGASYGGRGGGSSKATYGSESRPNLPGSGGGAYSFRVVGGAGGGLIYVSATNGTISIDGRVSADAGTGGKRVGETRAWGYGSGGSGGAILLESRCFRLGTNGVLSVRGGDTQPYNSSTALYSGSGGGGRIAVWCGNPWRANMPSRKYDQSNEPFDSGDALERFSWKGTANVDPGTVHTNYLTEVTNLYGKPGTIFFGYVRDKPKGMMFIFK